MPTDPHTFHDEQFTPEPGKFNPFAGEAGLSDTFLHAFLDELETLLQRHPSVTLAYSASCGPCAVDRLHLSPHLRGDVGAIQNPSNDLDDRVRRIGRVFGTLHIQLATLQAAARKVESLIAIFPGNTRVEMYDATTLAAVPHN